MPAHPDQSLERTPVDPARDRGHLGRRRRLTLSWAETGRTRDPNAATRRDFGTVLNQKALAYAPEAEIGGARSGDGVRCRIGMTIA